ncbi:5'-3' exonuclease PLD3-like [Apostichopus japonicus]|uniref:5'-3' exonuclease PLD3-like n=1 Tax=Stichopus japonicus TaxID=307972 RepID=UPI003AB28FBE
MDYPSGEKSAMMRSEVKKDDCHGWFRIAIVLFSVSIVLFFLVSLFGMLPEDVSAVPCGNACSVELVESIPTNLTFPTGSPKHKSTIDAWTDLIQSAEQTIDIAAFYWSLRNDDLKPPVNASHPGQKIFDTLKAVAKEKDLKIRIVVDIKEDKISNDTEMLEEEGLAEVRRIDMAKLFGSGVLHTKMWLVDGKHFAVGSANLDWRSLTEVKELSAVMKDCPCYADDMAKIFEVYWEMAQPDSKVPSKWPASLATTFNKDTPLKLLVNNTITETYLSSSPPSFCPEGRTGDIDAILDVMDKAKEFIDISVMSYLPMWEFSPKPIFWNDIDAKLRERALNGRVKVRLLTGYWKHTHDATAGFLQSLAALNNTPLMDVEVRQFVVPLNEFPVQYSRVNHCKFMITENAAYVGTSNWSADYFNDTGGIGFIINNTKTQDVSTGSTTTTTSQSFESQLRAVFERDWSSKYVYPVVVPYSVSPPIG